MIFENGLGTPRSKMVSEVLMCFCRKANVKVKRLLGYVFSYMIEQVGLQIYFFLPTSNFQLPTFYIL
jgi:hypothetical protein